MSYCLLADLKTYLGITTSTDDALMQVLLDAASARIDAKCGRKFIATADTARTYDPLEDVTKGDLWLDDDLSYITSVVNGDGTNVTADVVTNPRNYSPFFSLALKSSSSAVWTYDTDPENAITVTGRFAYMERAPITAIARASNVVTAQVVDPLLSVGSVVVVVGIADTSFNGKFTVTGNTGSAVTWAQTGTDGTSTTGYAMRPPSDIVTACRRLAAWFYRQKDTQQGDIDRPLLAGDGTVIMPTTLPLDVEKMLQPYERLL